MQTPQVDPSRQTPRTQIPHAEPPRQIPRQTPRQTLPGCRPPGRPPRCRPPRRRLPPPQMQTPPGCRPPRQSPPIQPPTPDTRYINKQAIRILLECILVFPGAGEYMVTLPLPSDQLPNSFISDIQIIYGKLGYRSTI